MPSYVYIVLPQAKMYNTTWIWAVSGVEEVGGDNSSTMVVRKKVLLIYDKHHQFITWYNVWNGGTLEYYRYFLNTH